LVVLLWFGLKGEIGGGHLLSMEEDERVHESFIFALKAFMFGLPALVELVGHHAVFLVNVGVFLLGMLDHHIELHCFCIDDGA